MGTNATTPITLDRLKPGQRAVIRTVRGEGPLAQRLLEMGLLAGEAVRMVRVAPAGDPLEIEILGYSLSLRRNEAAAVDVEHVQ